MKMNQKDPLRWSLLSAVLLLFLAVVLGGLLRSVKGYAACPGWPLCSGNLLPPLGDKLAVLGYLHRLASAAGGLLGLISLILAVRSERPTSSLVWPTAAANLLVLGQIVLGRWVQLEGIGGLSTGAHFSLALGVQGLLLFPLVRVFTRHGRGAGPRATRYTYNTYSLLSLTALGLTGLSLITGAVVVATGATASCTGWPLCRGWDFTLTGLEWLALIHRVIVFFNGISLAVLVGAAWKTRREQTAVLTAATAAGVLFLSQGLLGAVEVERNFPNALLALHQAAAVAVWMTVVVHTALIRETPPPAPGGRDGDKRQPGRMLLDLLNLTKPIVVSLLLVTTYAGMVIGAGAWPSWRVTFWVLLAGFLAAGGSGAVNQYIDRRDDLRMQRTRDRPIPAGRLTPGEGLAFGVGMTIISFYVMVAFVNLTAAVLTLAGIVYYLLIYSIFLKKTTVQNIVIGGGAGAIPPLVGWAAATGGLNVPSLFLFAVVFLWTPPHFWALAIVRRKDYARAEIPMLPVVEGVKKTRRKIFVYTVELVVLTLVLPLIGLGGSVYFILALGLGGWLLSAAWQVLKREGNRVAWRMYRYSSMYLAFLFAALMVDALI